MFKNKMYNEAEQRFSCYITGSELTYGSDLVLSIIAD